MCSYSFDDFISLSGNSRHNLSKVITANFWLCFLAGFGSSRKFMLGLGSSRYCTSNSSFEESFVSLLACFFLLCFLINSMV